MTDEVGEALLPFIEGGGPADHERNAAVAIGRFYAQRGYLTPAMRATAWWLLDNHGKAVGERPETDDTLPVAPAIPTAAPRDFVGKKKSEVKFWVAEGMIRSATPFSLKDLCKSVPGRSWNPLLKLWEWAAGPTAAQNLLDTFGKYDPDTDDGFKALLAKIETTRAFKVATDLPDLDSVKTVSWMHQRQAFHFIRPMVGAMLAMDMGTGKSLTTVARILDDPPGHTFIACPAKVVGVWPREFRNHGAVDVHIENGIRPKRGGGYKALTVKERVEAYDELRRCTCGRHHIAVSNYEVVIAEPLKSFLMAHTWDMLVMDESQRIQAYNGAQSKQLGKVGNKKAGARLALTGTPLGQSPLSIFGQYRALDQNIFGPSFTSFRNRYAIMGGYEGREIIGMNPATADELTAKIYQYAFRVLSDDVLDLPEVLPDEILTCTMEGAQARAYRDMEREAAAEFPGKTVSEVVAAIVNGESVAPNVLTKMLRLRQITGGGIKDDESGQSLILGDAKEKLLADWMMDFPAGEPLVVFAEFTHDIGAIRRVAEKQGRAYGEVSGQRNDLTADSEYPEGVEVLAVQIASGGAGVDLTRSCYGCYYSKSYSNEKYRQSRKRLHRPGQTRPVRFTHLVAADTVDEDAVANLDAIEAVNEGVLRQ